jgi:hypothetical protein
MPDEPMEPEQTDLLGGAADDEPMGDPAPLPDEPAEDPSPEEAVESGDEPEVEADDEGGTAPAPEAPQEELTPGEVAVKAFIEANPEMAKEFEAFLEAKAAPPAPQEPEEGVDASPAVDEADTQAFELVQMEEEYKSNAEVWAERQRAIAAEWEDVGSDLENLKAKLEDDAASDLTYQRMVARRQTLVADHQKAVNGEAYWRRELNLIDSVESHVSRAPILRPYRKDYYELLKAGKFTKGMNIPERMTLIRQHRIANKKPPVVGGSTGSKRASQVSKAMELFKKTLATPKATPMKAAAPKAEPKKPDMPAEQAAALASWSEFK